MMPDTPLLIHDPNRGKRAPLPTPAPQEQPAAVTPDEPAADAPETPAKDGD